MLTDKEAEQATRELMEAVFAECVKYAQKDGLPIRNVLRTIGNALITIANRY